MRQLAFRIVNVFAEIPLGGNPACVFEDGSSLDTATMQALALQFNLSETTFVLPSERASAREGDEVLARFFFPKHGAIIEDPGTGSACANFGGWLLATGAALPQRLSIRQGEAVGRPCRLGFEVRTDRSIRVSGRVVEIGRGIVSLPLETLCA